MSETDKKSVAALLYVTLRRTASRVIDVEWMMQNEDYARNIIHLARQQDSDELRHYAERYEALAFGKASALHMAPSPVTAAPKPAPIHERPAMPEIRPEDEGDSEDGEGALPGHYIGTLR